LTAPSRLPATEAASTPLTGAIQLHPTVDFPTDARLSELPQLFDPSWVWGLYQERQGHERQEPPPQRLRVRDFSHVPGRQATASYAAEWSPDAYLPARVFTIRVERDQPAQCSQYPDDPSLPGLEQAADPETALTLLNQYVLTMPARRVRVELVRYRPHSRAVLRHSAGRVWFYARVMRPAAATPLLAARSLVGRSGFVIPRLAGYWAAGAVMWMSEIPGENLRHRIRRAKGPEPSVLLDALQTLWEAPPSTDDQRPFNLSAAYRRARRSFRHKLREVAAAQRQLDEAIAALDPFVESWRPATTAHNDFYDDQMLCLPDGRVALVDFEEAGPGEPMLDVGNFLAHLLWASHFGRRDRDATSAYYTAFRNAAQDQFGWNERELALREAVCLFRVCTNAIRHPHPDWRNRLEQGLALVNATLR